MKVLLTMLKKKFTMKDEEGEGSNAELPADNLTPTLTAEDREQLPSMGSQPRLPLLLSPFIPSTLGESPLRMNSFLPSRLRRTLQRTWSSAPPFVIPVYR